MKDLPIGIQNFEEIRKNDYLYVDKTAKLLPLVIKSGKSYFLSRPRRFGKSLTLSTLEAMFQGKIELFKGLYAEEWVKEQAKNPNPVIKIDMSALGSYETKKELNRSIINYLVRYYIKNYKLDISVQDNSGDVFLDVISELYKQFGKVVVLIDEYDKPITDNLNNLEKAEEMRETLHSFYIVLKGCPYIKFVMVTGVSKFSKVGILSGLNNLDDISMFSKYGDIVGYTQKELEDNFVEWL
ncbi:AAA family ATPase, partial [bacterium]|nr:AAA family ATPase [bacterium]